MSEERYRELELIAKGGMGEVFRATMVSDAGVEKPVALKLLRTDVGDGFLEEAKIAMAMSHGNIVQTFDAGHREGRPFLAMELVEGTDLSALIARGPIPPEHALTIAAETLRGLEYAHRLRDRSGTLLDVVHRDISPANLLISRAGEVKIADFGIARSAEKRQGEQGVRGKMAYMAPEQLAGGAIDARADLYALGVVLYEMLVGSRPFVADDPEALRARMNEGATFDALPNGLRDVVQRSMHREAASRFTDAAEMREALEDEARRLQLRLSTTALRDWIGAWDDIPASEGFDARLGALLGGDTRTGTVEVEARGDADDLGDADLGDDATKSSDTRSYTGVVILALLVAAAMPFVGFAFDGDDPRPRHTSSVGDDPPRHASSIGDDRRLADDPRPRPTSLMEDSPRDTTESPSKNGGSSSSRGSLERAASRSPARMASMQVMSAGESATPTESTGEAALNAELWIASDPWAYVAIDGRRVGRTTLRAFSVSAGRHVIVLSNPSAELERRIEVDLEPGERKRLSVSLDE